MSVSSWAYFTAFGLAIPTNFEGIAVSGNVTFLQIKTCAPPKSVAIFV
jgi:hypothetical protein